LSEETTHKRLVQKSLFRTVSRNLIRQVCQSGFALADVVDFLNEILSEVISLACKGSGDSGDTRPGAEQKTAGPRRLGIGAAALSNSGHVALDEYAYVRPLRRSDCAALRAWRSDPAIASSLAGPKLEQLLSRPGDWDSRHCQMDVFAAVRKADEAVIGVLGYTQIDPRTKQAEFFKMIGDPGERGKGHAGRATRVIIDYGFEVLGLNRIYLYTLDGNIKNIRLNQSLGFRFEGLLQQAVMMDYRFRDVAVMALLRSQWPQQ